MAGLWPWAGVLGQPSPGAAPVEVALAGLAFSGAEATLDARFPHSRQYAAARSPDGVPWVHRQRVDGLAAQAPAQLRVVPGIESLKGRDRALAVALVVGAETVVSEQFGALHKLLVLIRAQALFFDFKSMSVVRAYPISFAYVDLLPQAPTDQDIRARVKLVYEGAGGKPGVIQRFVSSVAQAQIPAHVPRFVQVTSAQLAPEALAQLPAYLRSDPLTAQTWLADIVAEAVSTRLGIPIVPFAKGYAVGNVLSMTVMDGQVWELRLPQPDYEIGADLTGLKKIKFSEVVGGATTYVYGAYAQLRIEDALNKGLNTALKNGETRVIPASQAQVDDFPHFYDAINGLFTKAALAIDGRGDDKWLKTAAGKDIGPQLAQAKELMKQCK